MPTLNVWPHGRACGGISTRFRRFRTDESGAVAILFALSFIVLSATVGLAVDYSRAERAKAAIATAADAANLAAAKFAADTASKDPSLSAAAIASAAEAHGQRFFEVNLDRGLDAKLKNYKLTVSKDDKGAWTAVSEYSATSETSMMAVAGQNTLDIAGTSQASIKPGFAVLDIAMCVDSTGSMTPTLDAVKANATTFYDRLKTELESRGIAPFSLVRVRLAFFKDYGDADPTLSDPDPMRASAFFTLPDQSADFLNFAAPQVAYGGWDWPEADAICLNEAMDSPWMKPGDVIPGTPNHVTDVYPLIVVWTDSPAHGIGFANYESHPDYPAPARMPRTYEAFLDKWNDPAVIDQNNKQIIFFGDPTLDDPYIADRSAWLTIKDWPKFTVGGTLLEGNASMVEFLAEGIALNVRGLAVTN